MAKQDISDEQQQRESRDNVDDTIATKTIDSIDVVVKDSEDSPQHCGIEGSMCGANGVLCSSGDIFESIFPYLSQNQNRKDNQTSSPRGVRSIVGLDSSNLTPTSTPIRRGRFLVWPAVLDCGTPLSACGPVVITSSSSSGSE